MKLEAQATDTTPSYEVRQRVLSVLESAANQDALLKRDIAALQKRVAELEAQLAKLRNNKNEEEALREMMRDPRYWRHHDPEWVNRVRDGFRRLVGGKDE